jgi:transcriptional regulator with XRE-family HTH domain
MHVQMLARMPGSTLLAERQRRGAKLKQLREAKGLSARQVARAIATSEPGSDEYLGEIDRIQRTLRRCENGHNTPRGDFLLALLSALDADPASLEEEALEQAALTQRAKEVVAPFQRTDGGRPAGRVPSTDRGEGGD